MVLFLFEDGSLMRFVGFSNAKELKLMLALIVIVKIDSSTRRVGWAHYKLMVYRHRWLVCNEYKKN